MVEDDIGTSGMAREETASREVPIVAAEETTRDGISYSLEVAGSGDMFRARWRCHACGVSGEPIGDSTTSAEALGRAKSSLFDHHVDLHLTGQRTLVSERRPR